MTPDFQKGDGLIPVIIQDCDSMQVLMLGYMNKEAYLKTLETGKVTFFSRSKQRLWTKGEESGNILRLQSLKLDCDRDTLLIQARPAGPTCHKGTISCFGDQFEGSYLHVLENRIKDRLENGDETSYTRRLFNKGINKVAQKVGEEAVELVIEAKDDEADLFKGEAADLMYHYILLLQAKGFTLSDIEKVLQDRAN